MTVEIDQMEIEYRGLDIVEASKRLTELVANILKLNKLESQEIVPISSVNDGTTFIVKLSI